MKVKSKIYRKLLIAYYLLDKAVFIADYLTGDYSEANKIADRISKINASLITK